MQEKYVSIFIDSENYYINIPLEAVYNIRNYGNTYFLIFDRLLPPLIYKVDCFEGFSKHFNGVYQIVISEIQSYRNHKNPKTQTILQKVEDQSLPIDALIIDDRYPMDVETLEKYKKGIY